MCVINTYSLNIFIFLYVVFRAESIINLRGVFYSEHILIRHRRAYCSFFHRPFRNKFQEAMYFPIFTVIENNEI